MGRSYRFAIAFTQGKLGFGMNTTLETRLTILSNTWALPAVPGVRNTQGRALSQ